MYNLVDKVPWRYFLQGKITINKNNTVHQFYGPSNGVKLSQSCRLNPIIDDCHKIFIGCHHVNQLDTCTCITHNCLFIGILYWGWCSIHHYPSISVFRWGCYTYQFDGIASTKLCRTQALHVSLSCGPTSNSTHTLTSHIRTTSF